MDSTDSLPLVFESGVFRFDDDGVVHIHLLHTAADPHPMVTHPDGRDTHLPGDATALRLDGEAGKQQVRGHFRKVEELPDGFVLTLAGYDFIQVEGSGDVSVLMRDPKGLPPWFDAGKVHRFARSGSAAPSLWEGSPDPAQLQRDAAPAWSPPTQGPKVTSQAAPGKAGCLPVLVGLFLTAFMSFLVG